MKFCPAHAPQPSSLSDKAIVALLAICGMIFAFTGVTFIRPPFGDWGAGLVLITLGIVLFVSGVIVALIARRHAAKGK